MTPTDDATGLPGEDTALAGGQLAARYCGDVSELICSSPRTVLVKLPRGDAFPVPGNGYSSSGNGNTKSGHCDNTGATRAYAVTIYVSELPADGRMQPLPSDRVFVFQGMWRGGGWQLITPPYELQTLARPKHLIGPTPAELEAHHRRMLQRHRMSRHALTATAVVIFLLFGGMVWGISNWILNHRARWQDAQRQRQQMQQLADSRLAAAAQREASIAQALRQERELRTQSEQQVRAIEAQRQLDNLGRDAIALLLQNDTNSGKRKLQEALDQLRRRDDRRGEALLLLSAGAALSQKGDFAGAETQLRDALAHIARLLGQEEALVIEAHTHLATVCRAQQRGPEALEHLREIFKLRQREWGSDDVRLIPILQDLALTAFDLEQLDAAESVCARILAIRTAHHTSASPEAVDDLSLLALAQVRAGKFDEAAAACKRILLIEPAVEPHRKPRLWRALMQLAELYIEKARYSQGLILLEKALHLPDDSPHPSAREADHWRILAQLYAREKRFEQAEQIYTRLIGSRETSIGGDDPILADDACELAELYERQDRLGEAEALYKLAMSIREKVLGPYHPDVAKCALRLADLYRLQGKSAEADALYELAREIRGKSGEEDRH